jgi:hypothetical protein
VVDKQPWLGNDENPTGFAILAPTNILRSYKIMDAVDTTVVEKYDNGVVDVRLPSLNKVAPLKSITEYTSTMTTVRQTCKERNLIPLFHYTDPKFASLIIQSGLRMSTQGQGDGGVYVSTQGPASYGIGTTKYEVNIIKDCFGVERVSEYLGKGKLDVILVYGCCGHFLDQVNPLSITMFFVVIFELLLFVFSVLF